MTDTWVFRIRGADCASGVFLSETGWDVTVLERSPEIGEIGAGFAMSLTQVGECGNRCETP